MAQSLLPQPELLSEETQQPRPTSAPSSVERELSSRASLSFVGGLKGKRADPPSVCFLAASEESSELSSSLSLYSSTAGGREGATLTSLTRPCVSPPLTFPSLRTRPCCVLFPRHFPTILTFPPLHLPFLHSHTPPLFVARYSRPRPRTTRRPQRRGRPHRRTRGRALRLQRRLA